MHLMYEFEDEKRELVHPCTSSPLKLEACLFTEHNRGYTLRPFGLRAAPHSAAPNVV